METNYYQKLREFIAYYKDVLNKENFFYSKENNRVEEKNALSFFSEKNFKKINESFDLNTYREDLNEEKIIKKIQKINKIIYKQFENDKFPLSKRTIDGYLEDAEIYSTNVFYDNAGVKKDVYSLGEMEFKCVMLSDEVGYFEKKDVEVAIWISLPNLNEVVQKSFMKTPLGKFKSKNGIEFYVNNKFFDKFLGFKNEKEMLAFFEEVSLEEDLKDFTYKEMLEEGYISNAFKVVWMIERVEAILRDAKYSKNKKMVPLQLMPMEERKEIEKLKKYIMEFPAFKYAKNLSVMAKMHNEYIDGTELKKNFSVIIDILHDYTKIGSFNSVSREIMKDFLEVLELPNNAYCEKLYRVGKLELKRKDFVFEKNGVKYNAEYESKILNKEEKELFAKVECGMYECMGNEIFIGGKDIFRERTIMSDNSLFLEEMMEIVKQFGIELVKLEKEKKDKKKKNNKKKKKKKKTEVRH